MTTTTTTQQPQQSISSVSKITTFLFTLPSTRHTKCDSTQHLVPITRYVQLKLSIICHLLSVIYYQTIHSLTHSPINPGFQLMMVLILLLPPSSLLFYTDANQTFTSSGCCVDLTSTISYLRFLCSAPVHRCISHPQNRIA